MFRIINPTHYQQPVHRHPAEYVYIDDNDSDDLYDYAASYARPSTDPRRLHALEQELHRHHQRQRQLDLEREREQQRVAALQREIERQRREVIEQEIQRQRAAEMERRRVAEIQRRVTIAREVERRKRLAEVLRQREAAAAKEREEARRKQAEEILRQFFGGVREEVEDKTEEDEADEMEVEEPEVKATNYGWRKCAIPPESEKPKASPTTSPKPLHVNAGANNAKVRFIPIFGGLESATLAEDNASSQHQQPQQQQQQQQQQEDLHQLTDSQRKAAHKIFDFIRTHQPQLRAIRSLRNLHAKLNAITSDPTTANILSAPPTSLDIDPATKSLRLGSKANRAIVELEEKLTRVVVELDGVESGGAEGIRERRRSVVRQVMEWVGKVEDVKRRAIDAVTSESEAPTQDEMQVDTVADSERDNTIDTKPAEFVEQVDAENVDAKKTETAVEVSSNTDANADNENNEAAEVSSSTDADTELQAYEFFLGLTSENVTANSDHPTASSENSNDANAMDIVEHPSKSSVSSAPPSAPDAEIEEEGDSEMLDVAASTNASQITHTENDQAPSETSPPQTDLPSNASLIESNTSSPAVLTVEGEGKDLRTDEEDVESGGWEVM
ncbi:hypothetical protein HDU67_008819 [Dinochytrium kinnereticum]|nr:hypothetical protein HDU67_008819 [Dinochytrium kinnereticum]